MRSETSHNADLLGDAESYLAEARQGNVDAADEALDLIGLYMSRRSNGLGGEPWNYADDTAADWESEAIALGRPNNPKPEAKPSSNGGFWSWLFGG